MSLSVQDITTRVQRQFGDEANSQVSQQDVIRWINDAMREIAHANKLLQVKAVTDTLISIPTYALPTDISKLYSVKYNGVTLSVLSIAQVDNLVGVQDQTIQQGYPTGTPTHYWIWAGQINLWPAPDSALVGGLIAYYTRTPIPVGAPTDVPELPDEYHGRIVEYCLAQAFELDENFEVANAKMAAFKQGIVEQKDNDQEQQESYPFITDLDDEGTYYATR